LEEPVEQSQPQGIYHQGKGKTTIAPEVLLTIARLTALEVPGVSRMSNVPGGVDRLFQRGYGEGVQLNIRDDVVYADLFLVMNSGFNVRDVSRQVQRSIARAISEMVGMQVGRVNIHIEDIDYQMEIANNLPREV
jgi:uncharacterized alkaline shock family protein YloU